MSNDNIRVLGDVEISKSLSYKQNLTEFPANPKPRTLIVKDGQPFLYTEVSNGSGYFSWTPIGAKQNTYLHSQGLASTTWTVTHGLNQTDFAYFVYDNDHVLVLANSTVIDANTIEIHLSEAITGTAIVFGIGHVTAPGITAVESVTINTIVLRDTGGVLTVNNNAVAFAGYVDSSIAAIEAELAALSPSVLTSGGNDIVAVTSAGATITGNLIPSANVAYSLGDATHQWKDLWLSGSTINLGGAVIKTDAATGAVAIIPQVTDAIPNPVGIVISATGSITPVATTGGAISTGAIAASTTDTAQASATVESVTALGERIDAILTNTDSTALNSLAELVAAFQAADGNLTSSISSLSSTAGSNLAAEITNRIAAVSAENDARVAGDDTLQGQIYVNATAIANEASARATAVAVAIATAASDATTKADAAQVAAVATAKIYLGAVTADIVPATDLSASLGSPTKQFHSLYVGPGTLYVNGKAVIQDNSDTMTFSTNVNQNLRLQTSGSGHLELQAATGTIDVKGTLSIESGKRIVDNAGVQVQFGDDVQMNANKVIGLGTPTANTDAATKKYVDDLTTNDSTLVRTLGVQAIAGTKTFTDDVTISGNLIISGTATTVNSETIKLADNLIDLNSNYVAGVPTENAGIRVMRGDEAASQVRWNEATDKWEVSADSSTFSVIAITADVTAATTAATTAAATDATTKSNAAQAAAIGAAATDATTKANAAQAAAATDATTKANAAQAAAIGAAETDATTKANAAQAAAISAAATDATTKSATAKSEAISAAATDATTKSATAKSEAISAAATDATTKANAAQAAAIAAVTNGAGAAFDTLKEIQDAMATDTELSAAIAAISNVPSATKLQTARTINGASFDGTTNISFSTSAVSESTNLYYTDGRARAAVSAGTAISYNNTTGVITNTGVTALTGGGGITVNASTGSVTLGSSATSANTAGAIVSRGASGEFSAGVITATATSARYADLAEKYTADADYEPGTVLIFGGDQEVTMSTADAQRQVVGVVSTDPAYIMNSELSHEYVSTIALTGRVPVKVIGPVRKGDFMVSAANGYAQACADPKLGTVIGKAIENFDGDTGVIEVLINNH